MWRASWQTVGHGLGNPKHHEVVTLRMSEKVLQLKLIGLPLMLKVLSPKVMTLLSSSVSFCTSLTSKGTDCAGVVRPATTSANVSWAGEGEGEEDLEAVPEAARSMHTIPKLETNKHKYSTCVLDHETVINNIINDSFLNQQQSLQTLTVFHSKQTGHTIALLIYLLASHSAIT